MKFLVADGRMDLNASDRFGSRPLHLAVRKGNLEIVKILVADSPVDRYRKTAMQYAAEAGNTQLILLLSADCKVAEKMQPLS